MAQLWMVRHGQASLFAINYDVLSPQGEAQAAALGKHWGQVGVGFDHVFSGPAKRQRDTAMLARTAACEVRPDAPWPEPVVIDQLDEHDAFGMLARVVPRLGADPEIAELQRGIAEAAESRARSGAFQRIFEVIMARWLRDELDDETTESWPAFRERVLAGLEALTSAPPPSKRVVGFTSVGPLAVLLQRALGTDDLASFQTAWRIRNASVTRLEFSGRDRLTLDGFNTLPHLPDPATWTFR